MPWKILKRAKHARRGALPDRLADVLSALGDPVRLHIVRPAAERPRACNEFGLDLPSSTLSHHLKVLHAAGVLDRRREGTRLLTFIRRAELDRAYPGLLEAVLHGA